MLGFDTRECSGVILLCSRATRSVTGSRVLRSEDDVDPVVLVERCLGDDGRRLKLTHRVGENDSRQPASKHAGRTANRTVHVGRDGNPPGKR
jgi:hypothetical protein